MSFARKQRRAQERLEQKTKRDGTVVTNERVFSRRTIAGSMFACVALGAGIGFFCSGAFRGTKSDSNTVPPLGIQERPVLSLSRLVDMSDDELAKIDFGFLNLICGDHLPRSGKTTVTDNMKVLEHMTDVVRQVTASNLHRWIEKPAEFENSEAYFKTAMMLSVLGQDFGAMYNPKKIEAPSVQSLNNLSFYEDADDIFISGLLGDTHMGTCASMPVLAVAVGRRLGYPLKLVCGKAHLFFRWDDGRTRMNFEYMNGIVCKSDEDYRKWPFPISDAEVKAGWYLSSLTPSQELSVFLALRGDVLRFHRTYIGALRAYIHADCLWPEHPDHCIALSNTASQYLAALGLASNTQPGYQVMRSNIPPDPLQEVKEINALYDLNKVNRRGTYPGFPETNSFDSGFPAAGQGSSFGVPAQQPYPPSFPLNDR